MPQQQQQQHHSNNRDQQHHHLPSDIRQLMMRNRDRMPRNGQVTVLLFREGDQVGTHMLGQGGMRHFYRVGQK